jgi:hypothetical protein
VDDFVDVDVIVDELVLVIDAVLDGVLVDVFVIVDELVLVIVEDGVLVLVIVEVADAEAVIELVKESAIAYHKIEYAFCTPFVAPVTEIKYERFGPTHPGVDMST